jgi:hypothetical protein
LFSPLCCLSFFCFSLYFCLEASSCLYYYYYYYYCYYCYYLLRLSCHSVAVVLTLVQEKQIRINIHKRNNTKHIKNNTKHSKYKYTYYQNTHTLQNPHISKQVKATTVQDTDNWLKCRQNLGIIVGENTFRQIWVPLINNGYLFLLKCLSLQFIFKFLVTIILYLCFWLIYPIYRKAGCIFPQPLKGQQSPYVPTV